MSENKSVVQRTWGAALVIMGIGVFFRIPQVMPELREAGAFASGDLLFRVGFYLLGILLVGGGLRKLYLSFRGTTQPPGSQNGTS